MVFEDLEVQLAVIGNGPERVVVVRQRGEEDAQEEACRWISLVPLLACHGERCGRTRGLRRTRGCVG